MGKYEKSILINLESSICNILFKSLNQTATILLVLITENGKFKLLFYLQKLQLEVD